MIIQLDEMGTYAGLNISSSKPKIITRELANNLKINNNETETVKEKIYLQQLLSLDNRKKKKLTVELQYREKNTSPLKIH